MTLATLLGQDPDADVPAVALRRGPVHHPDPRDLPYELTVVVSHGEEPPVLTQHLPRVEALPQLAGLDEPHPCLLAGELRAGVLLLEDVDVGFLDAAQVGHQRTAPLGSATNGDSTPRSPTAALLSGSTTSASVTTAAASSCCTPLETAAATAACSAVRVSDGKATVAAAYVRPKSSRTAAPSAAPVLARADLARVTSLASSGSSSTTDQPT